MDIVLDRSLFAGITPLTPEQGEDRGTSAETGAMLLLPHFPLFSSSHKARRPQLLCEVDNNVDFKLMLQSYLLFQYIFQLFKTIVLDYWPIIQMLHALYIMHGY